VEAFESLGAVRSHPKGYRRWSERCPLSRLCDDSWGIKTVSVEKIAKDVSAAPLSGGGGRNLRLVFLTWTESDPIMDGHERER